MKPTSHHLLFRTLLSTSLICFGFLAQAQDSSTGNFTATNAEGPLNLRTTTSAVATNRLTILGAAGATAGFVGIGTTAPADLLHINGIARANQLNLVSGTLNTTAATTNMGFNINGTNRMTLLAASGNLGIGTAAPVDLLHVNGFARANQLNLVNGILNTASGTTNMGFNINGTNRMTLLAASGNLGIGTATPSDLLHVNGIARANQLNLVNGTLHTVGATNLSLGTNGVTQMTLVAASGNLGIGTNAPGARISFENVDATTGTPGIAWHSSPLIYGIYRTAGTWTAPNYQQLKMAFATGIVLDPGTAHGKSFVDVQGNGLRVTSGNLGVGTAAPADLLHVNGIARANEVNLVNGILNTTSGTTNMNFNTNGINRMTLLAASGNLGIGTNAPGARISFENVDATTGTPGITWQNSSPLIYGIYRTAGTWTAPNYQQLKMAFNTGIVLDPGTAYAKSFVDVQGNGLRVTSGNFNIGTAPVNTTAKFQLNYTGTAGFTGAVIKNAGTGAVAYAELTMYNNIDKIGQFFFTSSGYSANSNARPNAIGMYTNGTGGMAFIADDAAAPITFATANTQRLRIAANGNVGIGTSNPNERLTVNGIMYGREVKVDATVPGPDYVFEKDYDLMTLEEIKVYIDENKHLPEVPSAKEMETNGLKLGEMNMLLLKKIEELTLHLLAMEERMKTMQKQLDSTPQK
jgi:hypothetical protein